MVLAEVLEVLGGVEVGVGVLLGAVGRGGYGEDGGDDAGLQQGEGAGAGGFEAGGVGVGYDVDALCNGG